MPETMYPRSLREVVQFLRDNPLVLMETCYAGRRATGWYVFLESQRNALWFARRQKVQTAISPAEVGLDFGSGEFEVGIEFFPRMFIYIRGTVSVNVRYADRDLGEYA